LDTANIVMIFLAGVALAAMRFGHGAAVVASIASVLVFDFFFVEPVFSFVPTDVQYVLDLLVMLGIGLLISELTSRLRSQLRVARDKEESTSQLYQLARRLSQSAGVDFLLAIADRQIEEIFTSEASILLTDESGDLAPSAGLLPGSAQSDANFSAAQWAADNREIAGAGTDYYSNASSLFVPMIGTKRTVGVLGISPRSVASVLQPERLRVLETCASLIALSIERDQSFLAAQQAQVQVESEQFRNHLLSAVSHDLRTPLASIAVTAADLLEESTEKTWPAKRRMLSTIFNESHRLCRQIENLLGYARLTSGPIVLKRQWHDLEELVGTALSHLQRELGDRNVLMQIDDEFPLVWVAGDLMHQVFINLLENAIRYAPPKSDIDVSASATKDSIEVRVADSGPGLPPDSESKLFERFYRGGRVADGNRGIGLGLAICKAIVSAHGGQIRAGNRPAGGAEFIINLPCPRQYPASMLEEANLLENS
jgi:two-component system, OmpR family, sensor histidine kinase KdpD